MHYYITAKSLKLKMTCTKNENAMEIQLSGLITWEKSLNFHETPQKGSINMFRCPQ